MLRLFLFVLAWPLAIVLAPGVQGWRRAEYPHPPAEPPGLDAEDRRIAARVAAEALARFAALPAPVGEWFPLLRQQVLDRYGTLVVFRRAPAG